MTIKEIIKKYFKFAYKFVDEKFIYQLMGPGEHFEDVDQLLMEDELCILCGKGHALRVLVADVPELINNGCPHCKKGFNTRQWKYSYTYESLGFIIKMLPETLDRYKKLRVMRLYKNRFVEVSSWMLDINNLKGNESDYEFYSDNGRKNVTKEICDIVDELWYRAYKGMIYDDNMIILHNRNSRELYQNIKRNKRSKDDIIFTKCEECGRVHVFSSASIGMREIKCVECKNSLFVDETGEDMIGNRSEVCLGFTYALNTFYASTLYSLRALLRKEKIEIEDK